MALLQDSQPDLCLLAKSGGCSVYQLRNESGEGTMTVYEVFPGATILYNDFHMAYCDSSFETRQDLLCIDYCREGRMEYAVGNDAFSYGNHLVCYRNALGLFFRLYRDGNHCGSGGWCGTLPQQGSQSAVLYADVAGQRLYLCGVFY